MRNSERILACRSLILEDIDFWNENLGRTKEINGENELIEDLKNHTTEIQEAVLDDDSLEVATIVAGYISRSLETRSKCKPCKPNFKGDKDSLDKDQYLNLVSRGRLTVPSAELNEFVHSSFAILDYVHKFIRERGIEDVRAVATKILEKFAPCTTFTCTRHVLWGT